MSEIPFTVEPSVAPGSEPLTYERLGDARARITARAEEQRTGGYAIEVTRIVRDGVRLLIHAQLHVPPRDAIVTQVLTRPAQTVSLDEGSVRGIREVVLLDASGAELARITA